MGYSTIVHAALTLSTFMLTNIITVVLLIVYLADLARTIPRIGKPRMGIAGRLVGQPATHLGFASLFVVGGVLVAMGQTPAPRYAGWVLVAGGIVHAIASIIALVRKPERVGPVRIKDE